ncbi:MAG: UvrD-helicase domain-containing protein [Burkholderiaceae bacterium]
MSDGQRRREMAGADEIVCGDPGALAGHPLLERAIFDGCTVLEADAGTGKTWTICRLVVRALLERDLDIERMAVLTFTNAAAAELRQRIAQLIDSLLSDGGADDPFFRIYRPPLDADQVRARLSLARASLDGAMIGTIHGYCQRVLNEHSLSLGRWDDVEPTVDGLDALDRVLADWWRTLLEDPDPRLRWLVGAGGGLRRQQLRSVLQRLIADPRAEVWPPPAPGEWRALGDELRQAVEALGQAVRDERESLAVWRQGSRHVNRKSLTGPRLTERLAAIEDWVMRLPEAIESPPGALAAMTPRALAVKAVAADGLAELDGFAFFAAVARVVEALARRASLAGTVAAGIVGDFRAALALRHRRAGVLPFDGLLTTLAEALVDRVHGEPLADQLRARFPLAFVDEFQDTDPVQWRIFARVYAPAMAGRERTVDADADGAGSLGEWSGGSDPDDRDRVAGHRPRAGCALVLVGDPKQAIYGFRNADVHTYLAAAARAGRVLRLNRNQRASPALVASLNAVIRGSKPFLLSGIAYAGAQPADPPPKAAALPDDGRAPLTLVTLTDADADPPAAESGVIERRAVDACAGEIARLLARADAPRATDIAVLVRTARQGTSVKRALNRRGIGAVEISRDSVFGSPAALELHRLLAALAERDDPAVLLGGAVTSLLAIDCEDSGADADDARAGAAEVSAVAGAGGGAQAAAGSDGVWLDDLVACARSWSVCGPAASMHKLIFARRERGGPLAGQPVGERLLTDLLHLIDLLAGAEPARHGPAQAARWLAGGIAQARAGGGGADEAALRLESDESLVRIQTIHTSKGLEYPIVFLPFLWSDGRRRLIDEQCEVLSAPGEREPRRIVVQSLTSARQELLAALAPTGTGDAFTGVAQVSLALERDALAERLRLGYVALTRAAQRIYLAIDPSLGALGPRRRSEHGVLAHWLLGCECADDAMPAAPSAADCQAALTALVGSGHASALPWHALAAGTQAVADPHPADPHPADPHAADPHAADPHPADPHPADPHAADPHPIDLPAAHPIVFTGAFAASLVLARASRRVTPAWTRRSFTGLMRAGEGGEDRIAGPDHDQTWQPAEIGVDLSHDDDAAWRLAVDTDHGPIPLPPTLARAAQSNGEAIREQFARGAVAGVCLHAILEDHDFTAPLGPEHAAGVLRAHGFDPSLGKPVARWLGRVLAHDLSAAGLPFRLADLHRANTIRELPFLLGATRVAPSRLSELVADHLPFDPIAAAGEWSGYLNGFIDVVARVDGRYWVLDWKSNWLGPTVTAYDQPALTKAIRAHGYALQIALYVLAVHRWLRARLHRYEYERDFGGVGYLFLRGVGDARGDDPTAGVYANRPSWQLIDELDRLFCGELASSVPVDGQGEPR